MGLMHTQGIVLLSLALGGIQIQTLLLAATANRTASAPKAQRFETAILDPNPLPGIPTPPHVGDAQSWYSSISRIGFQSTPPAWGATAHGVTYSMR